MQIWLFVDAAAGRLEPEGKAEVPRITIVSDAVGGSTKVDLDGKSLQEEQTEKLPKKWKRAKGADWTEKMKEEKVKMHFAEWISVENREEVNEKIQIHLWKWRNR